jgi:negative regulator of flagellin synthesis FlgM
MEINKTTSDRIQQAGVDQAAASKAKSVKDSKDTDSAQQNARVQGSSTEKVAWSADSQIMAQGLEAARNAPDVRADRVAALKAQLADGSYKVDATKLADKMIGASLEDDLLTRNG